VSFVAGVAAWLLGGGVMWLIGAVLIGLVVPFTFIVVMPVNHRLLSPGRNLASRAIRSVLSLAAALIFLVQLLKC
jgi:hypothetical protein